MYAIKVVLQPPPAFFEESTGEDLEPLAALLSARPARDVQHVTLRRLPRHVVAMTFVVASGLLAAENAARSAWNAWLTCGDVESWRLVECGGDLMLGVAAARDERETPSGW
ncbi:hypothetical protein [Streptomyces sp. MAR25Y5]|uniref:hypothetical protein n=1 Tax=Streptomyces sp. MAR25Y5 TaxID=2962028 RepID=UPI0020B82C4E|nr:hypothetical protein [Streptomyces sp. MAR25Y5]MCP3771077.1 hypothetical protein [Streptomyces sp. MAR25Y5]